jgi:hypothetical protein
LFLGTKKVSERAKKFNNVMPIWEVIDGTSEDFQEVFSEQWLGNWKGWQAKSPTIPSLRKTRLRESMVHYSQENE